jgi:ADP-ribosylation factor-binding protein GGA
LNNFVRLLSPKYQADQTSERVKQKAITLLQSWRNSMRQSEKLAQVCMLLGDQGLTKDIPSSSTTREQKRMASIADEEKAQLLTKLLYSKNPADLQEANRMIKTMVKLVGL